MAIGPAGEVGVPAGTVVIDGSGRYLMPGLVDMHTHICDRNDLILLVANGVTTMRNLAEYPGWARLFDFSNIAALKSRIERGDFPGPTIYATGPVLEGRNPVSLFFNVITDEEDVSSVRDRVGVMVRGQWYARETLDRMLEKLQGAVHVRPRIPGATESP